MLSVYKIGEKIAVARKMKNLSQAQLAALLAVSAQAVGKWERGESMPDIVMFGRISETLGVDLNYFGSAEAVSAGFPGTTYASDVGVTGTDTSVAEDEAHQKPGWNMSGSSWIDADFSGLHGLAERFSGANIGKCKFIGSELSGLILKGNNIHRSDFSRSDLSKCKFSGTNFDNNIFIDCDFSGNEFLRSSIKNCDFSGVNLTDALFKWSTFQKINLSGSALFGTSFQSGHIIEITFEGGITNCSFQNCDFTRVEFNGAIIRNTFFKNCKLKRVKFINCKADGLSHAFMKSCKADLSDVILLPN